MTGIQATARHMGRLREQAPTPWRCPAACLCVRARVRGLFSEGAFLLYIHTHRHTHIAFVLRLPPSFIPSLLARVHTHTHTTLPPGLPTSLWPYYLLRFWPVLSRPILSPLYSYPFPYPYHHSHPLPRSSSRPFHEQLSLPPAFLPGQSRHFNLAAAVFLLSQVQREFGEGIWSVWHNMEGRVNVCVARYHRPCCYQCWCV